MLENLGMVWTMNMSCIQSSQSHCASLTGKGFKPFIHIILHNIQLYTDSTQYSMAFEELSLEKPNISILI